jgi:arabinose-5-phosphate isomerase
VSDKRGDEVESPSPARLIRLATEVLRTEANAVLALADRLDGSFVVAVDLILRCAGRVVVTGIGKSGHIGGKVAATLASTGTPAFFLHPAEAGHGDLGMIAPGDVVLAISNSGENPELLGILPFIKRRGAKVVAMTGNPRSSLGKQADAHLDAGVIQEACPLGLAPTASTTAALALGDALALALLDARGFTAEDFASAHPGGALGRRLVRVREVMHTEDRLPRVLDHALLKDALLEMSQKGLGMTGVVNETGKLVGIFTDGDLRRTLERRTDIHTARISSLMNTTPRTISHDRLAVEAVQIMETHRINGLLVVTKDDQLVGALNMHDLFRAGVV